MSSNCIVLVCTDDNHVTDIISEYDIAYRDLLNKGLQSIPENVIVIPAYCTYNGRVKSKGYRFTKRENGTDLYCKKI